MRNARNARRGAYTLVELVVSMSVATILMGGLASTIVLASRAMPGRQTTSRSTIDGYYAAEQIAGELLCAKSFTVRSATAVEFTVGDRGDDADEEDEDETIRYEWSGTPGDPLTRQYNGGTIVDLADDLNEFTLTYDTRTETTTTTETTTAQSEEIPLASFDNWPGVDPLSFLPSSARWAAEYCQIAPPDGVSTLNIVRVKLMMRAGTSDPSATVSVSIHRPVAPGGPLPQANPIGTPSARLTSTLPEGTSWTDFMFSDVAIDTSDTELVILLKGTVVGTAYAEYYYWKSAPADTHAYSWTTDTGGDWDPRASASDDYDMPFYVYGTYETEAQEITTNRYFLRSVGITLRIGSDAAARVQTAGQVLNQPDVTGS